MNTLWEERLAQRFYFDLRNDHDLIKDDEGVEAIDLDQATTEAQAALDEMRGASPADMSEARWQLDIRDEEGAILKTLPLNDDGFL